MEKQLKQRLEEAEGILKYLAKNRTALSRPLSLDWERQGKGGRGYRIYKNGKLALDYLEKWDVKYDRAD